MESGAGLWRTHLMMELLLAENRTSRWSSEYLVRRPAVLVEMQDDIYGQRPSGKPEGLDVSVFSTGSVSGLPVAPHPYG